MYLEILMCLKVGLLESDWITDHYTYQWAHPLMSLAVECSIKGGKQAHWKYHLARYIFLPVLPSNLCFLFAII